MKVLIDNNHSFAYAHGGIQTFINNLIKFLPNTGVEVEPLRWWDEKQFGDIIHFFYRPTEEYLNILKPKTKIVINVLLGPITSFNWFQIEIRRIVYNLLNITAAGITNTLSINYSRYSDAIIYHSNYEKDLGNSLFKADNQKSFVILPGVKEEYLIYKDKLNEERSEYLVTLSTIYEVKNSVFLALLAKKTEIPIVFLGRPFDKNSIYYRNFLKLVDDKYVIYLGDPEDKIKAKIMANARGFILLSRYESAPNVIGEASACGCPLILSDRMWARSNYNEYAKFINIKNLKIASKQLLNSYERIAKENNLFPVKSWSQVASEMKKIYESTFKKHEQ